MNRKTKFVLVMLVTLAAILVACGGRSKAAESPADLANIEVGNRAGMRAPDFVLTDVKSGAEIALSDLRGQPVLLNFWATWCAPCRLEMPHLQEAYQEYRDEGFTIIAIDAKIDDGEDVVVAFLDEFGLTFPVVKDKTGEVETDKYNVLGYPTSVFIDRNGVIQYVHRGPMTKDFIEEKLKDIL